MKHLPEIILKAIDHKKQRYETAGDYFVKDKKWHIRVSKINADYELLAMIHELIEFYLTQKRGIKEEDITAFDIKFEQEREQGRWKDEEPGNDLRAPYFKEHQFSTLIEQQIANELGADWKEYEDAFLKLPKVGK